MVRRLISDHVSRPLDFDLMWKIGAVEKICHALINFYRPLGLRYIDNVATVGRVFQAPNSAPRRIAIGVP